MNTRKHRLFRSMAWMSFILLGLWTTNCVCSGPIHQQGQLATTLTSPTLHFSHTQRTTQSFLIYNKGIAPIEIDALRMVGQHAQMFQWKTPIPLPIVLHVGETQGITIQVSYRGEPGRFAQARLEISTTSDLTAPFSIALLSLTQQPWPVVTCGESGSQDTLDFGAVATNQSITRYCRLYNRGNAPMTLQRVLYLSTYGSPRAFRMEAPSLSQPIRLETEQHTLLQFLYDRTQHEDVVSAGYFALELFDDKGHPLPRIQINVKPLGKEPPVCFAVQPEHIDWGETHPGCFPQLQHFEISAITSQDPRCQQAQIIGIFPQSKTAALFRAGSKVSLPFSWRAGNSRHVAVEYRSKQIGSDLGIVQVQTNVDGHPPLQVKVTGKTSRLPEQQDVFRQQQQPTTDVLWVIENSPAMNAHQKYLRENLQAFMEWNIRTGIDYRVGVITTDLSGKQDTPGCLRGTIKFITPQTPNPIGTFLQNAMVGTTGSNKPQPLEALYRALHNPACNHGFLRKGAKLEITVVSSTPDVSPQSTSFYIHAFKQHVGPRDIGLLRMSAVVGPPPHGCLRQGISAVGNPRLWEVARGLLGTQESLCSPSWGTTLSNLGVLSWGYRTEFMLTKIPESATLKVTVNGNLAANSHLDGWVFNPTTNSVYFSKLQIPPPGAKIDIRYHPLCFSDNPEKATDSGIMR